MTNIWEFFDNMSEIVYATEINSDTIVYINKYGLKKIGILNLKEAIGKKTLDILKNFSLTHSLWNNTELKVGEFIEFNHYNEELDQILIYKKTLIEHNGKKYKLVITINTGESLIQKKNIESFFSNENMISDVLRLSLAESTPNDSIKVLLKHLGTSLHSDRVYVFEQMPNNTVKNTYEWCAQDVEPQILFLQEVPFDVVALWYEAFNRNENIIIQSLDSIKESDPKVYETLLPQHIDSLVVSPIIVDGIIIGFYGVDNPPKNFLNHISAVFMMLGYFIASLIKRRNLLEKLEKMSYYDQLTGALNRHGMNEFVENVNHNQSIGIVYCDLMGLKKVNDTLGHLAGDNMLIQTFNCLAGSFPKESIFRVGGDEFLIMSSDVSKEDMDLRLSNLRNTMSSYNVNIAIGAVWEEKCNGRILELLKKADEQMYYDKSLYYSKNDRRK